MIDDLIVPHMSNELKKILSYTCRYFLKYRQITFNERALVQDIITNNHIRLMQWLVKRYGVSSAHTWLSQTHSMHHWCQYKLHKLTTQHYYPDMLAVLLAAGFPKNAAFAGALVQHLSPADAADRLKYYGMQTSKRIVKCAGKVQNRAYLSDRRLAIHYLRGTMSAGHIDAARDLIAEYHPPSNTVSQFALRYGITSLQNSRCAPKYTNVKKAIQHGNISGLMLIIQRHYPHNLFSNARCGDALLNNMYVDSMLCGNMVVFAFLLNTIAPRNPDYFRIRRVSTLESAITAWGCIFTTADPCIVYDMVCLHFSLDTLICISNSINVVELLCRDRLDFIQHYISVSTDIAEQFAHLSWVSWSASTVAFLHAAGYITDRLLRLIHPNNIGFLAYVDHIKIV